MYREPDIVEMLPRQLTGMRMSMSLTENRTPQLWRSFIARRGDIINRAGEAYYSVQQYGKGYFETFNQGALFDKWAAVEVTSGDYVPEGMEHFTLPGGTYALFSYRGVPEAATPFFQWIFGNWMPASAYRLDDRPHFEILGSRYKSGDPQSEEEVYIPVIPRES